MPDNPPHLAQLIQQLRSLAAESPERQTRLEELAQAYAAGCYKVDPEATAARIIDDAIDRGKAVRARRKEG